MGGLSVYKAIANLLPQLNVVYTYDNQGYPYGELQPSELIERVIRCVNFVTEQYCIDAVVIACNSASTIALPALRDKFSIPIVGVVPALKPANQLAKKGITLLATPGTVEREYTKDLVNQFVNAVPVQMIGSTELVNMAEEKLRGNAVDVERLSVITSTISTHSDVVVLGCTHFPLLKAELDEVLGGAITFVDSGDAIARRVADVLKIVGSDDKWVATGHVILSSAPEGDSEALEQYLAKLNFTSIQHCPQMGA
jgi:glutamate racemase